MTFGGCFGWLHSPSGDTAGSTAILVCSGLAHDKLSGHRPFRLLADTLAADGYPVLRFDYPDTGDSLDVCDAEHWSLWQHSIDTAIDWLRAQTGATRIVLVGLRIGAALAALAAERRKDVAGLIMLEPVLRGRSFLREAAVEQMVSRSRGGPAGNGLDPHGLGLSPETTRRLQAMELRLIQPPVDCPVAVFSRAASPVLSAFLDAWRAAGSDITAAGFDGLEPFLRRPDMNHEGDADTARIVAWLRQAAPQAAWAAFPVPPPIHVPLQADRWVETPFPFGPERHLFGILCQPAVPAAPDLAVVILNTSGHPHYGFGRLSVELARRLAAEGVASLRMDFAGLGDSIGGDGSGDEDVGSHVLETDREADISAAFDALQTQGYRRFALQGLCSGAYHALYGALADRRVAAVVLINLPMFTWRAGDSFDLISVRKPGEYLRGLAERDTWIRLRQRRLSFVRPAFAVRRALAGWWRTATRPVLRSKATFGQRCLTILSGRRTRTLFLYSAGDPGLAELEQAFAPDGIPPAEAAELRISAELDHTLSRSNMHQIATEQIAEFLKRVAAS